MSIRRFFRGAWHLLALGCSLAGSALAQPSVMMSLGQANIFSFVLPASPGDGSTCNIEVTFPDGKKVEAEMSPPQYQTHLTYTPTQLGGQVLTWQGKDKFRGINSKSACPGSGSVLLSAVVGNVSPGAGVQVAQQAPQQAPAPAYVAPPPAYAPAPPAQGQQWINLTNFASGFCLDSDGRSVNGGSIRMWNCVNHPNQIWTLVNLGSGYRVMNRNSNFCLDTDGSRINRSPVRTWACANHPNQIWNIQNVPTGGYRLINMASGLCLDTDGSSVNGGEVRMWSCAQHPNQTWR